MIYIAKCFASNQSQFILMQFQVILKYAEMFLNKFGEIERKLFGFM